MQLRRLAVFLVAIGLSTAAFAQDAPPAPGTGAEQGSPANGRGRGFGRGMGMGAGSGVMGTVTELAADHLTVKNSTGETWTVNYSANTHFVKQPPRLGGVGGPARGNGEADGGDSQRGAGFGGPPTPIKATDIKVGDTVMAGGEVNRDAKTVGAVGVMLVDPERARQMHEMEANYGKTWLMGRVTAVNDTRVTLEGGMDHAAHTFVVDENTTFRRRREPITLADVQVGESVRVEGSVKDGQFLANSVAVMMQPGQGGSTPRQSPPPQ